MADHAAALSPLPGETAAEADFAAICCVLGETARGRWFLDELSRRQRNADTVMVLDAVARIEAALTPQLMASAVPAAGGAAELARLIADGRAALQSDAAPGPAREALEGIRDVSRTLRDCGADARICDLLDRQAEAIDAGFAAALAILDQIQERLQDRHEERRDTGADAALAAADAATPPAPAQMPAAETIDAPPTDQPPAATPATPSPAPAAPPVVMADAPPQPQTAPPSDPAPALATLADVPASPSTSLGAALIADGVVALPEPRADPLAAFARLTQAERLALFS